MGLFAIDGIGFDGWWTDSYQSLGSKLTLDGIGALGADSVSITGNSWTLATSTSSTMTVDPAEIVDAEQALSDARARGLGIMLKPQLGVADGTFSGAIAPANIPAFFADYKAQLLEYATLAQKYGAQTLCLGNEIDSVTTSQYKPYWDDIISAVRQVYSGKLTYAATWYGLENVSFLDKLDYIGINPYLALSNNPSPSYQDLVNGWTGMPADGPQAHALHGMSAVDFLHGLSQSYGKPVLFTEIGFPSTTQAATLDFWKLAGGADQALQADLYRAFFDVWGPQSSWLAGAFLWGAAPYTDPAGEDDTYATDYEFRGKPAESIIANAYGSGTSAATQTSGTVSTITLRVAGALWNGAPAFSLAVDGKIVGNATAEGNFYGNDWRDVSFSGSFGAAGPQVLQIYFSNDAYGGPGQDRNLYVQSVTVNGKTYAGSSASVETGTGIVASSYAELWNDGAMTFGLAGSAGLPGAGQVFAAGPGGSVVSGLTGNDTLVGGGAGDLLYGQQGDDLISGASGRDTLYGGDGVDILLGGADPDLEFGNAGDDQVFGNSGQDTIYGNQGGDTLSGGQDADALFGGQGNDLLAGNLGADLILGNVGDDRLFGGQGDDTVYGGQGNDTLSGGQGNDLLFGNLGADRFSFGAGSGNDTVRDFSASSGDRLDLQGQSWTVGQGPDGSAVLTLSGGGTVTLAGIARSQVSAGSFA